MSRGDYARSFTVERATTTDDGLGNTTTWAADADPIHGQLMPASRSALERAQLLSITATHMLVLPAGFDLTPDKTRLKTGGVTYMIRDVTSAPRLVTALAEAQS